MLSDEGKSQLLKKYSENESNIIEFNDEIMFYTNVKAGKINEIKEALKANRFYDNINNPLSDDNVQSMKYHFTITASLLARYCTTGGMEYTRAYELSDYYIKKADKCKTIPDIIEIYKSMCIEYTENMYKLKDKKVFSKHIIKSIDYINSHLHKRITIHDISEYLGLNETYFSKLFSEETGCSASRYIIKRKIETARNLLRFSDYSCSEISELLAFSSQSHFISKFHSECGLTPLEYRNMYYNHTDL